MRANNKHTFLLVIKYSYQIHTYKLTNYYFIYVYNMYILGAIFQCCLLDHLFSFFSTSVIPQLTTTMTTTTVAPRACPSWSIHADTNAAFTCADLELQRYHHSARAAVTSPVSLLSARLSPPLSAIELQILTFLFVCYRN